MNISSNVLQPLRRPIVNLLSRRWKSSEVDEKMSPSHKLRLMHYYNTLQVKPQDPPEAIRESYLALAKFYHPDNPQTGNPRKFIRIKESYEKIKAAPFWQDGESPNDEIMTHEELIKHRKLNYVDDYNKVRYNNLMVKQFDLYWNGKGRV